jgi:hypothetical protein
MNTTECEGCGCLIEPDDEDVMDYGDKRWHRECLEEHWAYEDQKTGERRTR